MAGARRGEDVLFLSDSCEPRAGICVDYLWLRGVNRPIPATAERFGQPDIVGGDRDAADQQRILGRIERAFRVELIQKICSARLVKLARQFRRHAIARGRLFELGGLEPLLRQSDKRVLDVFQRAKDRRLEGNKRLVALCGCDIDGGGKLASIENRHGQGRADRPTDRRRLAHVASAGEAGRGFAVVASEVKTLANQTAKATGEISSQIFAVQNSTRDALAAIGSVADTIEKLSEISSGIAAAVEEQTAVTREIAQNMQIASTGVDQISESVTSISAATNQVAASTKNVVREISRSAAASNGATRYRRRLNIRPG